ncbi:MAG: class F sortase [Candidatus Dormiibacterota bacterium]
MVPAQAPPTPVPVSSASNRLRIPRISVDAAVEAVGVDPQGDMAVPARPDDVGWYQPGVRPGQPGDAVVDGHLDWTTGPAVFWQLKELQPGDEIFVTLAGDPTLRFVVSKSFSVPYTARPDSFGLFSRSGSPTLSLITCDGAWDATNHVYQQRLVVDADLSGGGAN